MPLRLYNTLTRRKDVFTPLDPANVRMYVCGPTVYDEAHIGNARPVIVFDVLFRLLTFLAKRGEWDNGKGETKVTYVRNITDVDDKINTRAAERGITIRELTEETAAVFRKDVAALGTLPPTVEPRATDNIAEMIAIIARLIDRGHAYAADGHVLFSVPSLPDYGRLSRRPLDELIAGARVEVAPYKRGDTDFVLWKPSAPDLPGWDSPWGRGRPGWHIECSAMSHRYLGETFDIHGGGIDLVFPHHENERAQTCGAFGHDVMANVWMHNGFLQVEGEKMSKSLGNFFTIGDLLRTGKFGGRSWPGQALRLAMLRSHYRQPLDWTNEALIQASRELRNWASHILLNLQKTGWFDENSKTFRSGLTEGLAPSQSLLEALEDDLNFAEALAGLREQKVDQMIAVGDPRQFFVDLKFLGLMDERSLLVFSNGIEIDLGTAVLFDKEAEELRTAEANQDAKRVAQSIEMLTEKGVILTQVGNGCWKFVVPDLEINSLIDERKSARAAKNWAESDRIRDELAEKGVLLKDNKDGTTSWEPKR